MVDEDSDYVSSVNNFRKVIVTITNVEVGWGVVNSYPDRNVHKYKVPLYLCTIEGINANNKEDIFSFKCIRFDVQHNVEKNIGPKVVGLKDAQSYLLKWVYQNNMLEFSWQVKDNWMIHRCADNPQIQGFGALGCVEITGKGEWRRFNNAILELTDASSETEVSLNKLASVYYEEVAVLPPLEKY